jgi:hypothetical protein
MLDYDAILDLYTNTVEDREDKLLVIDVARMGKDRTVLHYWRGHKLVDVVEYTKQTLDITAEKVKMFIQERQIPFSRVVADEGGVGGGLCDMLKGIKGFLSQSSPTESRVGFKQNFDNLKAQCAYKLAEMVNNHKLAINTPEKKDVIVEELQILKAKDPDVANKYGIISKDKMKEMLGRSPDHLDCLIMRMVFEVQPVRNRVQQFYRTKIINPNL